MIFKKETYINADDIIVDLSIAFHALRLEVERLQFDIDYLLSISDDLDD